MSREIWMRGCFVASSGNVTDELIIEYLKKQDIERENCNFEIGSP